MSTVCSHIDSVNLTELPAEIAGARTASRSVEPEFTSPRARPRPPAREMVVNPRNAASAGDIPHPNGVVFEIDVDAVGHRVAIRTSSDRGDQARPDRPSSEFQKPRVGLIEFGHLRDLPVFEGVSDAVLSRAAAVCRRCARRRRSVARARGRGGRVLRAAVGDVRPHEALPRRHAPHRRAPSGRVARRAADRVRRAVLRGRPGGHAHPRRALRSRAVRPTRAPFGRVQGAGGRRDPSAR